MCNPSRGLTPAGDFICIGIERGGLAPAGRGSARHCRAPKDRRDPATVPPCRGTKCRERRGQTPKTPRRGAIKRRRVAPPIAPGREERGARAAPAAPAGAAKRGGAEKAPAAAAKGRARRARSKARATTAARSGAAQAAASEGRASRRRPAGRRRSEEATGGKPPERRARRRPRQGGAARTEATPRGKGQAKPRGRRRAGAAKPTGAGATARSGDREGAASAGIPIKRGAQPPQSCRRVGGSVGRERARSGDATTRPRRLLGGGAVCRRSREQYAPLSPVLCPHVGALSPQGCPYILDIGTEFRHRCG